MCYISLNNLIRVRKTCPIAIAGEQVANRIGGEQGWRIVKNG